MNLDPEDPPATPETPAEGDVPSTESSPPPADKSYTVLVVDDEPVIRDVVEKELTQAGYKVVKAADGLEALRKADLGEEWGPQGVPDLIISDIMMPGMDGYELCQRLKENPKLKPVPFLFLSVKRETLERARAFLLGGQRFIVKPFNRLTLLKAVNERLKDAHQTQALLAKHKETFSGDLSEYTVLALVDMFLTGGWTGTLTVSSQNKEGRVSFRTGEITEVIWDGKESEEALAGLLCQVEGTFQVNRPFSTPPTLPTIDAPTG